MRSNMKQGNCDFNIDTLEKLDWKLVKGKSYEISLTYKYHNVDYFVVANINRQNGLVSIKESNALIIERIFKELSFIDKMKNRKPKFSEKYNLVFIGKFSQISDYSEVMIKNIKSHEKKVIHAIAIGDVETFNENIGKVNIKKIIDTNGNNLFHLLAINRRPNECISIFEDLIRLYGSDANDLFNTLNKSMESPINIAIDNHNLLFVEICCQYGLDIKNPIRYIRDKIYSKTLLDYLQFKRYYSAANSLEKNK